MKPTHVHAIQSRIARLDARIRDSVCLHTIAHLVGAMSEQLDPQAIPALIALLDHEHDAKDSVRRALLRYGESAEDSLRTAAKTCGFAQLLLADLEYRNRLRQLGCF